MKEIVLTNGMKTIVDDEDFNRLDHSSWRALFDGTNYYAVLNSWSHPKRMQRVIMMAPDNMGVDHINGDTLDNRKENLRLVTQSQNCQNRRKILSSSGYKGVFYVRSPRQKRKWRAGIRVKGTLINLGSFDTAEEAAKAYNAAAIKYFGEYAFTNSIQ